MKRFIQWWLRNSGIGGNIKLYGSMVILAIVLITNAFSSGNSDSSVEKDSYDNSYNYSQEYQEFCEEEAVYGYDAYGNYTTIGYEEECY